MGTLQNDYGSIYVSQIANAGTFYLIQAISQFATPLLISLILSKSRTIMSGWLISTLVTGGYYLAVKMIQNSADFNLLSVLMGILISYQLVFVIQNEGYKLSNHLLSLSLSHGAFEVYQLCLPMFQEGLIASLVITGGILITLLASSTKN